jgi:hypothetical protein
MFARLTHNGLFIVHLFTTLVMVGLTLVTALVAIEPANAHLGLRPPAFLWYGTDWPFRTAYWALLLGAIAAFGFMGCASMMREKNKYIILLSTTIVAAGHAYVASTIWAYFHLATGTTTYPLICLLSIWVFWRTCGEDGARDVFAP